MNRQLLVLCAAVSLQGCNTGPVYFEPASASAGVTTAASDGPVDCVALCERARPQLERDFAISPAAIDCPRQFGGANTCRQCGERFAELFGVLPTNCR